MATFTFGMATFKEFGNTWCTIMSLRRQLKKLLPESKYSIICINNAPDDVDSTTSLTGLFKKIPNGRLINYAEQKGTACRDKLFRLSKADFTFCMDCHVILDKDELKQLLEFCETQGNSRDLWHGVLLKDDLRSQLTHWEPQWRSKMFGTWALDPRVKDNEPFDIPLQGLGFFGCRTAIWPGLNPLFRGFGGEEGYLHDKFRQYGGKVVCLPWFQWVHQFRDKGNRAAFVNKLEDRIYNYYLGRYELQLPDEDVTQHFSAYRTKETLLKLRAEARRDWDDYLNTGVKKLEELCRKPKITLPETVKDFDATAEAILALPPDIRGQLLQDLLDKSPTQHQLLWLAITRKLGFKGSPNVAQSVVPHVNVQQVPQERTLLG